MTLLSSDSAITNYFDNTLYYLLPTEADTIVNTAVKEVLSRAICVVAMPILSSLSASYHASTFAVKAFPVIVASIIASPFGFYANLHESLQLKEWVLHLQQITLLFIRILVSPVGLFSPKVCWVAYSVLHTYHRNSEIINALKLSMNLEGIDLSNVKIIDVQENEDHNLEIYFETNFFDDEDGPQIPPAPPLILNIQPLNDGNKPNKPNVDKPKPDAPIVSFFSGLNDRLLHRRSISEAHEQESARRKAALFQEAEEIKRKEIEQKKLEDQILEALDVKKANGDPLTDQERVQDYYLRLDVDGKLKFKQSQNILRTSRIKQKEGQVISPEEELENEKTRFAIDLEIIQIELNSLHAYNQRVQQKQQVIENLTQKKNSGQVLTQEEKEELRVAKLSPEVEDEEIKAKKQAFLAENLSKMRLHLVQEDDEEPESESDFED